MLNTAVLNLCSRFLSRSRLVMGAAAATGAASITPNGTTLFDGLVLGFYCSILLFVSSYPMLTHFFGTEPTVDAPENPTLVQVVYVTRHGLRTPLSDSNEAIRTLPWECVSHEETTRVFSEDVELFRAEEGPTRDIHPAKVARSKLPPGRFDAQFPHDKSADFGKNCHYGQLTLAGHKVRPQEVALLGAFTQLPCLLFVQGLTPPLPLSSK